MEKYGARVFSQYANNTAVVLWGDHGYSLGEKSKFAKMSLWERATRTPLIITPPKNQRAANGKQVSNKAVSLLDLYPTLVKMCGLPANPKNQGNDMTTIKLEFGLVPLLQTHLWSPIRGLKIILTALLMTSVASYQAYANESSSKETETAVS